MAGFQDQPGIVRWKLHFASEPSTVYGALSTDEGRAKYWAESAPERDGAIEFRIHNYPVFSGRILVKEPPRRFALEYAGTTVYFDLVGDGRGGTDLTLRADVPDESTRMEFVAGWVSVLMAMKAAVDFGVDLRNHDPERSWVNGYADN